MKHQVKKVGWYLLFTFPLLFIFTTVVIVPFFVGLGYSFYSWDGLPVNPRIFVGFENFVRLMSDQRFWNASMRTVTFTVIAVITINVLGLTFALIATSKLRTRNIGRTMLFMPFLVGGLILGYIWRFILGDGLHILGNITGLDNIFFNWLIHPQFAFYAMILVATWQMAGYIMIIYITGIQAIPEDVIEAAGVDGAGFWTTLFKIKFPLIMPSFTICLFMTLNNSFKMFDVNLSLTGGGPANATELFAMNIFNEIFSLHNLGYGQAKAIVFFIIVAVITLFQVQMTKKREVMM